MLRHRLVCDVSNGNAQQRLLFKVLDLVLQKDLGILLSEESAIKLSAVTQGELKNINALQKLIRIYAPQDKIQSALDLEAITVQNHANFRTTNVISVRISDNITKVCRKKQTLMQPWSI